MTDFRRSFAFGTLALCAWMTVAAAGKPKLSLPSGISGGVTGTGGQIFQPDPKRPGAYLWKIWAQSANVNAVGSAYEGSLSGVTALLFNKGKASALIKAPTARYNSATEMITASGRVTVTSQTETGTTLVADVVTWSHKTDKIIATGNVIYRNGKTGLTMRVPRLTSDDKLTSASFGPGAATLH